MKCIGRALVIAYLLFSGGNAFAEGSLRVHYPDVFSHQDIRIESDQQVGRLLVTGGNATVAGTVEKGAVIVDGDLLILSGAQIKGEVIVIGGKVNGEATAGLERPVRVLSFGKTPVAGFLVLGLMLLGLASLIVFPLLVWLIVRIVGNTRPCLWAKELLLRLQQRWPMLYILLTLTISGLLLVAFTEIAWKTLFRHQMDIVDNLFIWLVRYFNGSGIDRAMIDISELGNGYFFWTVILAELLTLAYYRRRLEFIGVLVCLGGASFLNFLFKLLFERERPELFRVVEAAGYSFPSGHAMVSLCVYGMLAFLIIRRISRWRWRLVVGGLALVLVVAIGISRVYLGVHYPTDIVAGYAAGAMWLMFCISLLMWREYKQKWKASQGLFIPMV